MPLTGSAAISAYEQMLRTTLIYKNAESYCRVSLWSEIMTTLKAKDWDCLIANCVRYLFACVFVCLLCYLFI